MASVNAYVTFNGNCQEAFEFYRSVFGGTFEYMGKFGDMPPQEGEMPMPEHAKDKVMHVAFPISKETMLLGSDVVAEFGHSIHMGDNIALSINTDSTEEADKLFNGLSAGGKVTMPMNKTFWGAYFGMFTDKFGINWMVNYDER
jgi:PhnB protein